MSKYSKVIFFNLLIILAIGFSGCNSADTTAKKDTKPADSKPTTASEPEKKPEEPKSSSPETAATGDKIGVPECDEYIEKYEACVFSKVPEAMRETFKSSFEQSRKAWKEAAASPQAKASLASSCKTALETAKQSLAAYKCDW